MKYMGCVSLWGRYISAPHELRLFSSGAFRYGKTSLRIILTQYQCLATLWCEVFEPRIGMTKLGWFAQKAVISWVVNCFKLILLVFSSASMRIF